MIFCVNNFHKNDGKKDAYWACQIFLRFFRGKVQKFIGFLFRSSFWIYQNDEKGQKQTQNDIEKSISLSLPAVRVANVVAVACDTHRFIDFEFDRFAIAFDRVLDINCQ